MGDRQRVLTACLASPREERDRRNRMLLTLGHPEARRHEVYLDGEPVLHAVEAAAALSVAAQAALEAVRATEGRE